MKGENIPSTDSLVESYVGSWLNQSKLNSGLPHFKV